MTVVWPASSPVCGSSEHARHHTFVLLWLANCQLGLAVLLLCLHCFLGQKPSEGASHCQPVSPQLPGMQSGCCAQVVGRVQAGHVPEPFVYLPSGHSVRCH